MSRLSLRALPVAMGAIALLGGCQSLVPSSAPVETALPPQYTVDLPSSEAGLWQSARPQDSASKGQWWAVLNDATLQQLIEQGLANSPSLAVAAARLKQAQALIGVQAADGALQASTGIGPTRSRSSAAASGLPPGSDVPARTFWRAPVSVAYEVDLFGRIAASTQAARLDAQSQAALLEHFKLSLSATIASAYYGQQSQRAEAQLLSKSIELREQELRILRKRVELGDATALDVQRVMADVAAQQAERSRLIGAADQLAQTLGVLVGQPALAIHSAGALVQANAPLPALPAGLPSSLLERRLDIAAAQRQMAAANQRIGVAKAAFFPALRLTGSGGFESSDLGDLFRWSSRTWLLGPFVGTALSIPLLDGGRNQANLSRAQAGYEESVANYRQQVLGAFGEVQDTLLGLRSLTEQTAAQNQALQASREASRLTQRRHAAGVTPFFELLETQRQTLAQERALVQLQSARLQAVITLAKTLGGAW